MSCCNCKECKCRKTVLDWVQSITKSSDNSSGLISLGMKDKKDIYLRYEDGEIVGGYCMELEYYDLEVEQVEISTNPCNQMINYVLQVKEQ